MEKKKTEQDVENARKEDEKILYDITNIKSQENYTLPSKGYVYSEQDNIPSSITLRRMTTKEDKMRLRNASEDGIKKAILQACILEPNVDAGKLKIVDANFLFFKLRCLSLLNDLYKVNCTCNSCRTEFVHEVNLSDIPVRYLTKDSLKKMTATLPLSKSKVELKYPSLDDLISMGNYLRDYYEKFPEADRGETAYTVSGILYVSKVDDKFLLSEELEYFIDNMDIVDGKIFRESIGDLDDYYGFQSGLKAKCPVCGKEVVHGLPMTGEMFNPSN